MDFSKFNQQIDKEQMKGDYEEALKNGGTGDFPELPNGVYNITFENMEIGQTGPNSKGGPGRPMLKVQMRVQEAVDTDDNDEALEYFENYKGKKNPCLFFNRVLYGTKDDMNMIAGAVTWLNKLSDEPIVWNFDYNDLSEQVMDLAEDIVSEENKGDGLWAEITYEKGKFNEIVINEDDDGPMVWFND